MISVQQTFRMKKMAGLSARFQARVFLCNLFVKKKIDGSENQPRYAASTRTPHFVVTRISSISTDLKSFDKSLRQIEIKTVRYNTILILSITFVMK